MAQTGFSPILIYASGTATNVPLAADLTSSANGAELALNYADGKLYYKNSSGTVTLLASTAGSAGDVVGPASATDNAIARFDGTTGKLIQNSTVTISDSGQLNLTNASDYNLYASGAGMNYMAGNLGIGTTPSTVYGLLLGENLTGGTITAGIRFQGAIQSDVTGTARGMISIPSIAAASFTLGNLEHFYAGQGTLGAGASITNETGFYAASTLTGATNNYGFRGAIASGSGRWNLYLDGTAQNYLAGNTAIGTTTTTAAQLTVAGSSSITAVKLPNIKEVATISATAATGTINYDVTTQSVLYYTTSASANWTVNFRGSSGTSLDTLMSTGESISASFMVTQGSTAYYNSAVQVDGTTSGVTTKWQGSAPTTGNASSIDSYTYVLVKTGSATFTVFATQTKFS